MDRFCVAWSNHNWIRADPLQADRQCSKCGLVEPRRANRPDPVFCNHVWLAETFRSVCQKCGKVDRSYVVGPNRKGWVSPAQSANWRGRVHSCFARDGKGCFYCRQPLNVEDARLDHFIPRSKGGPDSLDNRRVACKSCDVRKRDQMPWEFMPERFADLLAG